MARGKQWVFSARTTEKGLKILNELKAKLDMSWDEMVIDAMCTKYDLDRGALALPKAEPKVKAEKPAKAAKPKAKKKVKAVKPKVGKPKVGKVKVYKDNKLVRTETAQGETVAITTGEK